MKRILGHLGCLAAVVVVAAAAVELPPKADPVPASPTVASPAAPLASGAEALPSSKGGVGADAAPGGASVPAWDVVFRGPARTSVEGLERVILGEDVLFRRGEFQVTADSAVLWKGISDAQDKGWEIYARGNVVILDGGDTLFADEIYFNADRETGILLKGEIRSVRSPAEARDAFAGLAEQLQNSQPDAAMVAQVPPVEKGKVIWYIRADEMVKEGPGRYRVKNAFMTPCDYGRPHYGFRVKNLRVVPGRYLFGTDALLVIGRLPVFYFPVVFKDLAHHWPSASVRYGHSSNWGDYVLTDLSFDVDAERRVTLNTDWRELRGYAGGLDFAYTEGDDIQGLVDTYWAPETRKDRDGTLLGKDRRSRYYFQHRQNVIDRLKVTAEGEFLSDRNVLYEYFESRYYDGKPVESYIHANYNREEYGAGLLGKFRVNRFQTDVETAPGLRFDVPYYPVEGTGAYLSSRNGVANLRKKYDESLVLSDERTVRADSVQEVYRPFNVGCVSVNPSGGFQGTYYERLADGARGELRKAFLYGTRLGSSFHRSWEYEKPGAFIDGLRHIVNPEIRFRAVENPGIDASRLYQFDDTDKLAEQHTVTYYLQNRLQTRVAGSENRDLADLEVAIDQYPVGEERFRFAQGEAFGNVRGILRSHPVPNHYFAGDVEYNPHTRLVEVWNAGYQLAGTRFSLSPGNRYTRESGAATYLNARYQFSPKWTGAYHVVYDWRGEDYLERRWAVQRELHDWILEFSYTIKPGTAGMADNHVVYFAIQPRGFDRLPFSNRQEGVMVGDGSAF
ncbi:MAG: hypothetical protein V1809_10545 [Planctomycetota bacterium]